MIFHKIWTHQIIHIWVCQNYYTILDEFFDFEYLIPVIWGQIEERLLKNFQKRKIMQLNFNESCEQVPGNYFFDSVTFKCHRYNNN